MSNWQSTKGGCVSNAPRAVGSSAKSRGCKGRGRGRHTHTHTQRERERERERESARAMTVLGVWVKNKEVGSRASTGARVALPYRCFLEFWLILSPPMSSFDPRYLH